VKYNTPLFPLEQKQYQENTFTLLSIETFRKLSTEEYIIYDETDERIDVDENIHLNLSGKNSINVITGSNCYPLQAFIRKVRAW